jgi:hypothetical protein
MLWREIQLLRVNYTKILIYCLNTFFAMPHILSSNLSQQYKQQKEHCNRQEQQIEKD